MSYMSRYEEWKTSNVFDSSIHEELEKMDPAVDKKEIEDRFYKELEFGTGGLRGIMGAGTNRLNKYTIGKATLGFGRYLLQKYAEEDCRKRGVVIGYDTRNNSYEYAVCTADILSGLGIQVYLHVDPRPTPQLSFSVRYFEALAGVVITASHNPREYNGYKIYDECGCQLIPGKAKEVMAYMKEVRDYSEINFEGNPAFIKYVDITEEFVNTVLGQSRYQNQNAKKALKIMYTPLHGTGKVPVLQALRKDGFEQVMCVAEQACADGDFSTVVSPNPEDRAALLKGIELGQKVKADIVIGTDPDCDRIGVAVRDLDGFVLLTGNQAGALLTDFVLQNTDMTKYARPAVIKTIVTSELGAEIARKKGAAIFSTLTGFKYIGEKMVQFEEAKMHQDESRAFDFLCGYEESYGYLVGDHAHDKDAVVAAVLICEMTARLKAEGKSLLDRLKELYAEYGYYLDDMESCMFRGKDGMEQMKQKMDRLRSVNFLFEESEKRTDYKTKVAAEENFGVLPSANVLKFSLKDGSWVAVRPSGTEPKIKMYYSIKAEDGKEAQRKLEKLKKVIKEKLEV